MVLSSIQYFTDVIDYSLMYEVEEVLQKMQGYFYKFCGKDADEARARVMLHTLTHYNPDKGELKPYIKSLIREILKDGSRLVCVDFLEETVSDDDSDVETPRFQNLTKVPNFADKLIADNDGVVYDLVIKLALTYPRDFVLLCKSLLSNSVSVCGFNRAFIDSCLKITKEHPRFNEVCLKIYEVYKDDIMYFLSCDSLEYLQDADFTRMMYSQQVSIVDRYTGFTLPDPDRLPDEELLIRGKLGDKLVYRVDYLDLLTTVRDMYSDTKISFLRLTIGDSYIARNLSGQVIYDNPSIATLVAIAKQELLSAVYRYSLGKVLSVGSENFYILCRKLENTKFETSIAGIPINLYFEEVDLCEV